MRKMQGERFAMALAGLVLAGVVIAVPAATAGPQAAPPAPVVQAPPAVEATEEPEPEPSVPPQAHSAVRSLEEDPRHQELLDHANGAAAAASVGAAESVAPAPVDCTKKLCIALTYDDGPSEYTPLLLDHLKAAGAPATFFMVGKEAVARPDIVHRVVDEGHEIGVHTWEHPNLATLTPEQAAYSIGRGRDALVSLGVPTPTLMRPPYGSVNAMTPSIGLSVILWDDDTNDWANRNPQKTLANALAGAKPGGIILMHDLHKAAVDATPQLIAELRTRGYTVVTVSQLLGAPQPNVTYKSGPVAPH